MPNSCPTGKCGSHSYHNIDQIKVDAIMSQLLSHNVSVSGNNPWSADTHNHGVIICAEWDEPTSTLNLTVTDKAFYVPCAKIWEFIDPLIGHVSTLLSSEIE
jgi:hypothetical protein